MGSHIWGRFGVALGSRLDGSHTHFRGWGSFAVGWRAVRIQRGGRMITNADGASQICTLRSTGQHDRSETTNQFSFPKLESFKNAFIYSVDFSLNMCILCL